MIVDLDVTIALRIVGSEKMVGDLVLRAFVGHLLARKVCPVAGDNGGRVRSDTRRSAKET